MRLISGGCFSWDPGPAAFSVRASVSLGRASSGYSLAVLSLYIPSPNLFSKPPSLPLSLKVTTLAVSHCVTVTITLGSGWRTNPATRIGYGLYAEKAG